MEPINAELLNANLIDLLTGHQLTDLTYLCRNPSPHAIDLFESIPDDNGHKQCTAIWAYLSANPAAIHLLLANQDKINWQMLSTNPAAIELLLANPEKINWKYLSKNPAAIHLLEANLHKVCWNGLSENPAAIHLLEANPDKINWSMACEYNHNPTVIDLLEAYKLRYHLWRNTPFPFQLWKELSANPAAIHLLESTDPANFDYDKMCLNRAAIHLLERHYMGMGIKEEPHTLPQSIWANPSIFTNGSYI